MLLTDTEGLHTADPRARSRRDADRARSTTSPSSTATRSACAPRRSAPAGCAARSPPPRWRARPASRWRSATARRRDAARRGGAASRSGRASRRTRSATPSFKLWLRYAKPARGRLLVDAGAARVLREQRQQPAAGRDHRGRGRVRGRRRGRGRHRRRGHRQGDRQLLRRRARPRQGDEDAGGPGAAPAGRRGGRAPRPLRAHLTRWPAGFSGWCGTGSWTCTSRRTGSRAGGSAPTSGAPGRCCSTRSGGAAEAQDEPADLRR